MDPPQRSHRSAPKRRASIINHARADPNHGSSAPQATAQCQPSQALPLVSETSELAALQSSTKDHADSREAEQQSSTSVSHSHWFNAASRASSSRQAVLWVLLFVCLSSGLGYWASIPAGSNNKAVLQPIQQLGSKYSYGDSRRSLVEGDALSNSNGCLSTIPKCEPGACATRNVMGVARWVCLRCLANFEPVVDASGQDNILQCVCPRGFYEKFSNATSCTRCEVNTYCPGGDKVESPTSRGTRVTCGNNLVTRNTGARSQIDCVAPAGYAQSSPTVATPCARSEYAPMYNRLAKCLKCQSGLEEPMQSNLTNSQRASKRAVCKVPPGRYVSQGLVRWCAQGFYREDYVAYDAAVAQICLACNPGITTSGAGAKLAADCSKVLAGYGIAPVYNVTGPQSIPALPQSSSGLPNASICDIGFYSAGGFCAECPAGTVTQAMAAQSIEECMVPPGYFVQSGTMGQCPSGTFRQGWYMYSDPRASNCTACGEGIQSEPRDLDENPRAANGSLVRATATSCFIEAGQGMIASGKNLFSAKDCPVNTYGASGKVYGWAAAPCKPCPRNMITDGLTRVNNSDVCINPDGFGYASEGASRCALGFYSAKGSRKPCQKCPVGRTTLDLASAQRVFTDCFVQPGFGVVSSQGSSSDGTGFLFNTSGLTDEQAAVLPVLECPIGYWGAGNAINSTCIKCPEGSITLETGSTSVEQCSVCVAGYGKQGSNQCTPCDFGSYHPGGASVCTQCPSAKFYPPVDGVGPTWEASGTTFFKGAIGVEFCVPKESQLSPDAGQAFFSVTVQPELTTIVPASSLADCIAMCPPDSGCMIQFETSSGSGVCKYAALPWDPVGVGGTKLKYKLPPATLTSASSVHTNKTDSSPEVKAKMMSSGFYARCNVPSDKVSSWMKAGVPLDAGSAQSFKWGSAPQWDLNKSEEDCQKKCDDSVICWGFLYDSSSRSCLYRGGEDALSTRSFFVLPNMTAVVNGSSSSSPLTGGGSLAPSSPSPLPAVVVPGSPSPSPAAVVPVSPSPTPAATPNNTSPLASPSPAPPQQGAGPLVNLLTPPSPSPIPQGAGLPAIPSPSPSPVLQGAGLPVTPQVTPSPSPIPQGAALPVVSSPSPSPSPRPSPSPSPRPSPSPSPRPSPSPSPSLSPSQSPVPTFPGGMCPDDGAEKVFTYIPDSVTESDCIKACKKSTCCVAQYHKEQKRCRWSSWDDDNDDDQDGNDKDHSDKDYHLTFKISDTDTVLPVGRSNDSPKTDRCKIPTEQASYWATMGKHLDSTCTKEVDAPEWVKVSGESECKKKCANSPLCWGFVYLAQDSSCLYRAGADSGSVATYLL